MGKTVSRHIQQFQLEQHQGDLPSPCINICRMHEPSGLCEGCFRTIDEIVRWGSSTPAYKRQIWYEIKQRVQAAEEEKMQSYRFEDGA